MEQQQADDRFRALVQHASDIITVLAADGTIRYQSPSIQRVLGYTAEDRRGASAFGLLHPDDVARAQTFFSDVVHSPGRVASLVVRAQHADGSWRSIEALANNLLADPAVAGIVVNARDITERTRAEEDVRRSEATLAAAQRITHLGSWQCALRTGEGRLSDESFRVLGYQPQAFAPPLERYLASVHPADW